MRVRLKYNKPACVGLSLERKKRFAVKILYLNCFESHSNIQCCWLIPQDRLRLPLYGKPGVFRMAHGYRVHRWFTILIAVLFTVLGVSLAARVKAYQAQDATPIALGDTVEGSISGSNFQALYLLTVADNTSVVITMRGGGGLDAYLMLKDEDAKVLAEDDDSGGAA